MITLILVTGVFVVVMACAELCLRWWLRARDEYYVWAPNSRMQLDLDPEALPDLPGHVNFVVNRYGERGDEIPGDFGRLYRVLVAGGSAATCMVLDQETSWPMVLQRELERSENVERLGASHVHVGNIAKSGVGSEVLDYYFSKVLRRYEHLDATIIMVGASDVLKWIEAGAPDAPFKALRAPEDFSTYFDWHPQGPFAWQLKRTALAEMVRRLHLVLLHPVKHGQKHGIGLIKKRKMRAHASELRTDVSNFHLVKDNFEFYLANAIQKAKAKSRRVIVVEQPCFEKKEYSKEELDHFWGGGVLGPDGKSTPIFYSVGVLCDLMRQISRCAQKVAEELGVEWVPVNPVIEPSLKSYWDMFHLTPRGAVSLAQLLAEVLLSDYAADRRNESLLGVVEKGVLG